MASTARSSSSPKQPKPGATSSEGRSKKRAKKRSSSRRRKPASPTLEPPTSEHWETLIRVTPDAVVTLRASGRLGRWSAVAARMTGRKRWEVQRRGFRSLFEKSELLRLLLHELDVRGTVRGREYMLRKSGGETMPVRIFASRMDKAPGTSTSAVGADSPDRAQGGSASEKKGKLDGDPERYLFLLHDLTEVQHIKDRLIETEKLSAMAKIAGSVAHEFRNPLNSLFISTDLLEDELEGDDDTRRAIAPTLQAIREEIERLNQIITHYLALSKIGGAEPKVLNLADTVRAFTDEMSDRAEEAGVALRFRRDDGNHEISVDPNQVRRVLLNVVDNGIDAIRMGRSTEDDMKQAVGSGKNGSATIRHGTITLQVRRMRRSVKVTIRDNGPGIPEDVLAKVFEPFFTNKPGGSGLGLYLVREIVHASGGAMTLSSSVGRGTSFSIRWPAVVPHPKMRARPKTRASKAKRLKSD